LRTSTFDTQEVEHYAALVLRASGEPGWFDLGPAAAIEACAADWRLCLRDRSSPVDERVAVAAALYQLLMAPVEAALAGARRLLVAPHGPLALVPFGLLSDGTGPVLAERYLVSYLTCGREMAPDTTPAPAGSGVVVFAAPDFEAAVTDAAPRNESAAVTQRSGFEALPGTRLEAEEIARVLANVTTITGADATIEALEAVRQPAVLHIATHGIFAPLEETASTRHLDLVPVGSATLMVFRHAQAGSANPMFYSGLALAGANRRERAAHGIVTAQEIAAMDLRGTQLVVLSACETGLGLVRHGAEFTGLRRALAIAGAVTQVTSLWKVADDATRALMGHYYRLLAGGCERAAALQRAQQAVRRDPAHPEWEHPFYWGAFVSSGAWGPMPASIQPRSGS
jgi:CHAT domain-containing protein